MSCVSDFAWPHCEYFGPFGTLSLSRCFIEKSTSLRVTSAQIHMWSMRESNTRLTNNQTDLWEPCVCLSVFPGACFVCAGSEEAGALIKEQAWYRDASLTAWGHAALMGSRWEPPDWTSSSKPTASWCTDYVRRPSSSLRVYSGIWRVRHQIKGTFSLNAALKPFIDHSVSSCFKEITC